MPHPVLRYEMNPRTGLPALRVPSGALTGSEREALQAELSLCYARLVELPDGLRRLRTRTCIAPDGLFMVRVLPGHPRVPTLLLTPYTAVVASARPRLEGKPSRSDRLEEACAALLLDRADGPGLEEALAAGEPVHEKNQCNALPFRV